MTDYRMQSYETPYSGGVAYSGANMLGSSDQFDQRGPQKLNAQLQPIEGWAVLHERWLTWDPAGSITFQGVNTRTQKGVLQTAGKGMAAMYQRLPVPSAVGEAVNLVVYAQCTIGKAEPFETFDAYNILTAGLMLGEDFEGNPFNSASYMMGLAWQKTSDISPPTYAALATGAQFDFPFPDGMPVNGAIIQNNCQISFYRVRLQQVRDTETEYSARWRWECSTTGSDWVMLRYVELAKQPSPLRSVGWGLFQDGSGIAAVEIDQFVMCVQDFSDSSATLGGVQIFGAV